MIPVAFKICIQLETFFTKQAMKESSKHDLAKGTSVPTFEQMQTTNQRPRCTTLNCPLRVLVAHYRLNGTIGVKSQKDYIGLETVLSA